MTFFGLEHFSLFLIYLCSSRVLCCLSFCFNNSIWGLRLSISLSLLVDVCLYMKVFLLVISYDGVVNGLDVVTAPFVRRLVVLLRCLFCSVLSDDESLYRWRWCFSLLHLCEISWVCFQLLLAFELSLVEVSILYFLSLVASAFALITLLILGNSRFCLGSVRLIPGFQSCFSICDAFFS